MRSARPIPALVFGGLVLIGSAVLIGSGSTPQFTIHDKAHYADPNLINFVRPGLVLKILSADIAADGTIRAGFRLTDPRGLPLDREGITTPGPVSISFIAASIPKGDTQYRAYTTRVQTSPITRVSATQPSADTGGSFAKVSDGEYTYTFGTRAPSGYDRTATHSIGAYATRDLREFDLDRNFDNDVFSFVPDGSGVTVVRDVVRTATCNQKCHDPLALHGGPRRKVELCVMCHQPQNIDPDTGNTVDLAVMVHKIHMGEELPSVRAGKPYQIIGNQQNVFDFSEVVFPAGIRNCEVCHDPKAGAAQSNAWLKPNRTACGSCHDNVNFATGAGHVDLPQVSDSQCANCHIPEGELEFDASVKGAHLDPRFSRDLPGTVFDIHSVTDGVAGRRPIVTFTIKDKTGKPILPSEMTRVALVLAGPTADYAGFVSEDASRAQGSTDGRNFWTFQDPIPANAKGTFSVGIEGYRNIKLLEGTQREITVRDPGMNKVVYFSVDGSRVAPRRRVVEVDKCNACHLKLELHGQNRNNPQHCVQCHNPNQTDVARRPASAMPAQTVNFRYMIHRIHTGEESPVEFTVFGFGGTPFDFARVIFPGDRRNCEKCHVPGSYSLPLPDGLIPAVNPRGFLNPIGPVASACTGCHTARAVSSHALAMTTQIGESCDVCHGGNADFSVDRVHAR